MSAVLIENLDPVILEKLEILAKQYGRTLQEEVNALRSSTFASYLLWVENI